MKNIAIVFTCALFLACRGNSQETTQTSAEESGTEASYPVQKTDAEWRAQLTDMEYYILRKAGTENPGTSEWLRNKEKGTYVCAACGHPLFKSETKFDSGTGWPSFDRAIEGNVAYSIDYKIGYKRTEEHCANCGGHLGHVFEDGPRETTGERHCINGAALDFVPNQ
ncbi:peptide-methionine (R)-S-oxide reductase MsrB [Robiginitalea aurantiaca]|uniref:peptide-methionine (R)-S-oxide reductase n=1 Tax=Robiginitalea aurantiaca TaxID=3056915 RepID=A0ABT7WHM7_9FLAO|nr:peptide-methionine (R)-S-oxide reductase MsrB [Robiginitalea aurantiaca]MDM9632430.1 peptide-methionine (R)-S-oxide reductase MsrB [Robiginitalea aurantiaca]